MTHPFPAMANLFHAYFHQDYDLHHGDDPMGGWREFAATQDRLVRIQVVTEIDRFFLNHPTGVLAAFHDVIKPDYVFADSNEVCAHGCTPVP